MENRYTQLFKLSGRIFTVDSPVIIAAGALLKDNQNGDVLAQLKFKNIMIKSIKAIKVSIDAFDISGEKIEGVLEYQYLDLDEGRDAEFGHKSAIHLPENTTRSFLPRILGVYFRDNTSWIPQKDTKWESVGSQPTLEEFLGDNELKKQYDIETGVRCTYVPLEVAGVWFCTCGAINHANETSCHSCGVDLSVLEDKLQDESLELRKDLRIEDESLETKRLIEQSENARKKRKIKQKRIIAIVIFTIIAAVLTLLFTVVIPHVNNVNTIDRIKSKVTISIIGTIENDVFANYDVEDVSIEYDSEKAQGDDLTLTGVAICTFVDLEQKAYLPFTVVGTIGTTNFNCTFGEGYLE